MLRKAFIYGNLEVLFMNNTLVFIFGFLFLTSFAFAHGGEDDIPEEEHNENQLFPEPYFSVGAGILVLFAIALAVNFWLSKLNKGYSIEKVLFVFVVLLFLSFAFLKFSEVTSSPVVDFDAQIAQMQPSGSVVDGVRVIEVLAFQYGYDPDPIVVNRGDRVRFILESTDVPHGFQISPSYGVREDNILKGEKRVVELVADEPGVFKMSCTSYCGSGHSGMEGKFIVKDTSG